MNREVKMFQERFYNVIQGTACSGKTAMMVGIAAKCALEFTNKVFVFSPEENLQPLIQRGQGGVVSDVNELISTLVKNITASDMKYYIFIDMPEIICKNVETLKTFKQFLYSLKLAFDVEIWFTRQAARPSSSTDTKFNSIDMDPLSCCDDLK